MIEPVLSDDAFLADIETAPELPSLLHLWWIGQSGYLVGWNQSRFLIDPYLSDSLTTKYAATDKPHVRMTRRVVDPGRLHVNFITASHGHTDHLDAATIRAVRGREWYEDDAGPPCWIGNTLVVPRGIRGTAEERWGAEWNIMFADDYDAVSPHGGIVVHGIAAAHPDLDRDPIHGWHRFLGYVFELGTFTVYHSGDTVLYDRLAERLLRFNIDVAILPINGKVGNMGGRDAARLAHDIDAKLVVPCHYEMFEFNTADPRDEFIPECERLGQPYKVLRAGERLTLGA